MLGSYMEDIGITAKEFEAACTQGKSITGKFHQQLFEQVPILDYRSMLIDYAFGLQIKNFGFRILKSCYPRFGRRMITRFSRG